MDLVTIGRAAESQNNSLISIKIKKVVKQKEARRFRVFTRPVLEHSEVVSSFTFFLLKLFTVRHCVAAFFALFIQHLTNWNLLLDYIHFVTCFTSLPT